MGPTHPLGEQDFCCVLNIGSVNASGILKTAQETRKGNTHQMKIIIKLDLPVPNNPRNVHSILNCACRFDI